MKPVWSDDLLLRSFDDVLQSWTENRRWSRTLRLRVRLLVDSRLEQRISLEDYALDRQQGNEDATECKRRQTILDNEINSRKELGTLSRRLRTSLEKV